ncbi:hypothetical protein MRX96_003912 [Rhipicephalus microplus]
MAEKLANKGLDLGIRRLGSVGRRQRIAVTTRSGFSRIEPWLCWGDAKSCGLPASSPWSSRTAHRSLMRPPTARTAPSQRRTSRRRPASESGGEARPEAGFRCPVCGARFSDRAREKRRAREKVAHAKSEARAGSGHHEGKVAERRARERRKDDVSALDSAQREPRACWAAPRGLRGGGVAGRAKAGRLTFFSFVIREQRGKNGWAAARLLSHADAPLLGYDDDDRPLLLLRAHPSQPG